MARRVQFGFVVCVALGLGIFLGSQGSRSLEKLMEKGKDSDESGAFPGMRPSSTEPSHGGTVQQETVETAVKSRLNPHMELEIREAKQSVLALLSENEKIRKEVLDLEGQIRRLTHSLAEEKLENDRLRLKIGGIQDQRTQVKIPAQNVPEFCEVIDINDELNLVVLNRGSEDGIQHRMQLAVIRDGYRVAQLEAVNVRSRITGAVITFLEEDETIVAGDRVIPARN